MIAPAALGFKGSSGLDTGNGVGDLVAGRLGGTILVLAAVPGSSMLSVGRMGFGVEPRRGTGTSFFRELAGAAGCLGATGLDACSLAVAIAPVAGLVTVGAGRVEPGCLGCTAVVFPEAAVATFALVLLERVGLGTGAPGCLAMPDFKGAAGCFDTGSFDTGAPFLTLGGGALALVAATLTEAPAAAAVLSFSRCFLCR